MAEELWLLEWFQKRGTVDPGVPQQTFADLNIFDAGLVDSFGTIELISAIEDHFGVEFDARDFQDRSFPFVRGLSEIIRSLRSRQAVS